MSKHPYSDLPDRAFWRKSVASLNSGDVDPTSDHSPQITPDDKVMTAGSCFAQHISRHLAKSGFNYLVTEKAHPLFEKYQKDAGFGVFTARYGNVYTSRQLVQLFDRAFGDFCPIEDAWERADGTWVDPMRPAVEPNGFATREEMQIDRDYHLECVRSAFENLDYFVFTLGLTECWADKRDGTIFPVCPGVAGGTFDPDRFAFVNLEFEDVVADMRDFIARLRQVNPSAKLILTVSPVPLMATATDAHVLTATTLSKSILRTATERLLRSESDLYYFPSYEIITGAYARGHYFAGDLRGVTQKGVDHVMRVFMKNFTQAGTHEISGTSAVEAPKPNLSKAVSDLMCEEELLDPGDGSKSGGRS